MQASVGVPVPASTQWELLAALVERCAAAVYQELLQQAAQDDVLHNDDTAVKILQVMQAPAASSSEEPQPDRVRTGIFTTGIVAIRGDRQIALYITDQHHAGESLNALLAKRNQELTAPIQMCDALSRNQPENFATVLAHCLAHARRRFYEVATNFPEACRHVLEQLAEVYRHEASCTEQGLSPEQRLAHHQSNSAPIMEKLQQWCTAQLDEKIVEPNSGLGKAIRYMLKHWIPLTLFLQVLKAPLDNNACERILKLAILSRKNSLFFRTEHGAFVSDVLMSLIQTCKLCGANPFDYLNAIQRHVERVQKHANDWLPWNYVETIAALNTS